MITDPVDGDLVIGLEGVVTLTNNETGSEVDVTEGMGISTRMEMWPLKKLKNLLSLMINYNRTSNLKSKSILRA